VPEADELELVDRARSGDLEAFAELVRRYERRVGSVLARLLDDARDVEEALQDTFVQAWRNLGRFRGESAVFTWLYRIAVNEALMRARRKRLPTTDFDAVAERSLPRDSEEPAPEEAIVDEDLRGFLTAKVRALPFEYRAPLVLRDVEGFSNQEVADLLGISLAAAKSRIHRARMQIRAELEAWERDRGS
jgi:RNA polymerase sigma-70 factor (ECF subfamily)